MSDSEKPIIWKNFKINRRLWTYFLTAALLMVCYYAYIYALEPILEKYKAQKTAIAYFEEEPEAAAIAEPLFTYYAGRAAFDLPASFSVPPPTISIDLKGPEASGRIHFTESTPVRPGAAASELKSDFERQILAEQPGWVVFKLVEEEDPSAEFGQPALLISFSCKTMIGKLFMDKLTSFWLDDFKDVMDSSFPKFGDGRPEKKAEPQEEKEWPSPEGISDWEYLSLNLVLDEGNHRLYFKYSTSPLEDGQKEDPLFLEAKKTEFRALVKNFLPLYKWVGRNAKPAEGALATGYGYIMAPDKGELESSFDLKPHYQLKQDVKGQHKRGELTFTISVQSTPGSGCFSKTREKPSRIVGGHIGCENNSFYSRIKTGKRIKPANMRSAMFSRSWKDDCGRETEAKAPHYSMDMEYQETRINDGQVVYDELAYLKGVWEILLNSIHRVE